MSVDNAGQIKHLSGRATCPNPLPPDTDLAAALVGIAKVVPQHSLVQSVVSEEEGGDRVRSVLQQVVVLQERQAPVRNTVEPDGGR